MEFFPQNEPPHAMVKVMGSVRKVYGRPGETYFDWMSKQGEYGQARDVVAYCLAVRPDSVCLDLGANVGFTTMIMASLCPRGHVYSFEPGAGNFANLCRTISANHFANVTPINLAVSDHNGSGMFREWGPNGYLSETDRGNDSEGDRAIRVAVTTVDDWSDSATLRSLDFIKIDVEGQELAALRGAGKTLGRFKPAALIEFYTNPSKVIPAELLDAIMEIFPHVAMVDHVTGLPIRLDGNDAAKEAFLALNNKPGRVDDLLCYFEESQLSMPLLAAFQQLEHAADWRARQPVGHK